MTAKQIKKRLIDGLPKGVGARAAEYVKEGNGNVPEDGPLWSVLSGAFAWDATEEGYHYWSHLGSIIYQFNNNIEKLLDWFEFHGFAAGIFADYITVGCQTATNKELKAIKKLIEGKRKMGVRLPSRWIVRNSDNEDFLDVLGYRLEKKKTLDFIQKIERIREEKQ